MSIRDKMKAGGAKITRVAVAGVLAVGLMPLPAFAADMTAASSDITTQAEAMSTSGYLLAATHAAAQPAPQFLGLTNPQARNASEVSGIAKIFGDDNLNEAVDPYLYNALNKTGGDEPIIGGSNQSPAGELIAPDFTKAEDSWASEAPQNLVLQRRPQIIVGTGNYTDDPAEKRSMYDSTAYARAAETQFKWAANSYHPVGVTYDYRSLSNMVETMYRLADEANKAMAADGTLKARYGDPMQWAKLYEVYIMGARGAVKQAIDEKKVPQRTVANVIGYDSGIFKIVSVDAQGSTATKDRYLEAVEGVTTNYYDVSTSEVKEGTTSGQRPTKYNYKEVTLDELKNKVDCILVGSQLASDQDTILGALAGLESKTYWNNSVAAGTYAGSTFGVVMNSVENAQNVGRILPGIYPEVLDQSDMIAFFFDNFYHLKDGKLGEAIESLMQNAVRNWEHTSAAGYVTWTAGDVADYNESTTKALLEGGVAYLNMLKADEDSGLAAVLTPTDNLSDIAFAATAPVAATNLTYNGQEQTGVTAGTGFTVTGGSATNAGNYEATVKLEAGFKWADGTTAELKIKWSIGKAANPVTATVKDPAAIKYSTKDQTIANPLTVSKAEGAVSYTKDSGDKYFTVDATSGKVTVAKKTPVGIYTVGVKATAAGNENYEAGSVVKTFKVTVKKAANTMTVKAKNPSVKAKALKKAKQTIKASKAYKVSNACGAVSYKKKSGAKVLTVASNGNITVKKGTKAGTYKVVVNVTAKGDKNYEKDTQKVTVKVKVK